MQKHKWKRIEVVVTSRTRNAVDRKVTWVRIPSFPPKQSARAAFLMGFACYARPRFARRTHVPWLTLRY